MAVPWNTSTRVSTATERGPSPVNSTYTFLNNWTPSSAHQIDTLNQAVEPVSILSDMEMQHELDFFANAQFTFDHNEPLSLACHKKGDLSSMTSLPEDHVHGSYGVYDAYSNNPRKDEFSYGSQKPQELLDQHHQDHTNRLRLMYRHSQHVLQSSNPPTAAPLSISTRLATKEWNQLHPILPDGATSHHHMMWNAISSVESTPVTSPITSPREMPWPTAGQHDNNYLETTTFSNAAHLGQGKPLEEDFSGNQHVSRQRQQSTSSYQETITSDDQDGDGENHETDSQANAGKLSKEDKRRRNTAASARFRIKKKMREQALQKTAFEMTEKARRLEMRAQELEKEIKWLKALIVEKNGSRTGGILG